jgi:hypothetical protein
VKNYFKRSLYLGVFICLSAAILSCEEDFTNIDSNVLTNTKFDTSSINLDVTSENVPLERVQSDNISTRLGQYLLGVYSSPTLDYEKIEASIVSQLAITTGLQVESNTYGADTTVVTKMDTVFLKLPYQVMLNADGNGYELDSIIGDQSKEFTLNIYRSNTYMNLYNPSDPTKINRYYSNDVFEKIGDKLNDEENIAFKPNVNDTTLVIKRRLFDDSVATTDTLNIFSSAASTEKIPFVRIPLNEEKFKELFLDKYETGEFDSQDAFNDYFRGLIIEPTGIEGSLISFSFNNTSFALNPSIEAYYTNTVLESGTNIVDTIYKNDSFLLSGFRVNTFNMDEKVYLDNDEIIIQGTAGSEGEVTLFDQNKIDELRAQNLLINDASLIFYINQSADTNYVPDRLYLYKDNSAANVSFSQVKDAYSESAFGGIAGQLERDDDGKVEKYTFRITDYVSDILSGETNYSPALRIKVFNPTDLPVSDTIFNNLSWNPKAVTLFRNSTTNSTKKAVLKISYSEKTN